MPTRPTAARTASAKKPPPSVPGELYLRDCRDLTLHGGIDETGHATMLAVMTGLGTKGLTPTLYLAQSKAYWQSGRLRTVLEDIGYPLGKMELYQALYPALTSALPLPSATVIDRVTSGGGGDAASPAIAMAQLQRCADFPRWRRFRFVGGEVSARSDAAALLLATEERQPGLLTDSFRLLLQALHEFHQAIDAAESRQRMIILGDHELAMARDLKIVALQQTLHLDIKEKWSSYFQVLEEQTAAVRHLLAASGARLSSIGSEFDADSLDSQLRGTGQRWGVVADVGADAMLRFARAAVAAQGRGNIWRDEWPTTSEGGHADYVRGLLRRNAGHLRMDLITALNGAWRVLIQRAMQQAFYASQPLSLTEIATAWSRRFQAESVWGTLSAGLASRPIAEGGALIVRTDAPAFDLGAETDASVGAGYLRIEPAQLWPHVAATRTVSRGKKFPRMAQRYQTFAAAVSDLQDGGEPSVASLYSDEARQILWPHGRVWQAVDLARTMAAQPGLMLCPEVLVHGSLRLPHSRWEQHDIKARTAAASAHEVLQWSRVARWFHGATAWSCRPLQLKRPTIYDDPTSSVWPLTFVDGGIAAAEVRLAVRFVAVGGGDELAGVASVKHLVESFAKVQAAGAGEAAFGDLLAEFGAGLRFEARPYFTVEGRTVDEAEWFSAVKTSASYYRLASGLVVDAAVYHAKTDQFIQRRRVYAKFLQLRLGDIWSAQQQALATGKGTLGPEEYLRHLSLQITPVLRALDHQALPPLVESLLGKSLGDLRPILRSYQAEGLAWMYLRLHMGFGVCLADEMGLGKTLQTIALLRTMRATERPSLVVMPKTLLYNWRRELATYGAGLRVKVHGDDVATESADVWLVTYPRLRIYQNEFIERDWNIVVLDEAQAIKNADTQVAEAAGKLVARYRLALTGTPVENRAAELWSIINWLNPGYLGRQIDFNAYTQLARSSQQKVALMAPLRESLAPVILRRMKSDPLVALGLPDKVHLDLSCDLSEEQMTLYEAVIATVMADDELGLPSFARRAAYLKAILHLKQICIHPELFYGDQDEAEMVADIDAATAVATKKIRQAVLKRLKNQAKSATYGDWLQRSGKVLAVAELIQSLRPSSRGILIFTQYRGAADILRRICGTTLSSVDQATTPYIHGGLSAEERLNLVDEFNDLCRQRRDTDACPVLILSLKAGGTGLNLTEADRVIHFDRWWNPAVEDQASDRAHRIGQKRSVFVHTLTSQSTIEESIGKMFVEKRRLAEDLLGAASADGVGDLLRNSEGFLDLVDPQRLFSQRLRGRAH